MPFNIDIIEKSYGPMIYFCITDPHYNSITEIMTMGEAEKLRNELTAKINSARNILNSKVKFKIGSGE
jgi:hypothetical protein